MSDFKVGDIVCKDFYPGQVTELKTIEGKEYIGLKGWLGYYDPDTFKSKEDAIKELNLIKRRYENQIKILENFKGDEPHEF